MKISTLIALVLLTLGSQAAGERNPRVTGLSGARVIATGDAPDGFGVWTLVSQGADQDVTNTTTLAASNLCMTIVTDGLYQFLMRLQFNASLTGVVGIRWNLTTLPANTFGMWASGMFSSTDGGSFLPAADVTTNAIDNGFVNPAWERWSRGYIRAPRNPDAGGTLCLGFANKTAGAGNVSRLRASSTLAYRRIN